MVWSLFSFELLDLHLVTNEIPRCCQLYTADSCGARAIKAYYLFKIARYHTCTIIRTCSRNMYRDTKITAVRHRTDSPFPVRLHFSPLQGRAWMSKQSHKLNFFFTENSLRLLIKQFTRLLYYKII